MNKVTDKVLSGPQRIIHRDWRSSEAFCYGDMPAYVFADWLEENIADIPAGLLQLLRESDA